ncbi:OmpA family protein [Brevundimonas sp.]|uniref:OmpA family protein n=1 Tax=Brevundimonas sp. TaxID=1871086 RepID=UPI0026260552|nr:OmpA family protein [Brevundimonas sp.]
MIAVIFFTVLASQQAAPPPPCMPPYVDEHVIYFPTGDATLDLQRAWRVALASDALEHGVARVLLRAYTDTIGAPEANIALSRRRGEAVADELVRLGVPRETITVEALGEPNLARPTGDETAADLNRRVVISWQGGDSGLMDRLRAAYCLDPH